MNGTLTTSLLNAAKTGVTVSSARAALKTQHGQVPGCSIKLIRAELNTLLADQKVIRVGQNVKVYFKKGRNTTRDIVQWRTRHENLVLATLQTADAWQNFHQIRALLAGHPGSHNADNTFLKEALAALVAHQRIQMVAIKLPDADIAHYYRCAPVTLTQTLCPALAQQAKEKLSVWLKTHRPRFSLVELKSVLKLTSDAAAQVVEHLIDEQLCVRAEGTMIAMFDAQARPGVPVSLRRAPPVPARPRRLCAPTAPRRAPRPALRPTRRPVPPTPIRPGPALTAHPSWSSLAPHHRHLLGPARGESLAGQHQRRPAANLQRAGPRQHSTSPPHPVGARTPANGHARRSEPWIGRASPPQSEPACSSSLSRAGPPSHLSLYPPPLTHPISAVT